MLRRRVVLQSFVDWSLSFSAHLVQRLMSTLAVQMGHVRVMAGLKAHYGAEAIDEERAREFIEEYQRHDLEEAIKPLKRRA